MTDRYQFVGERVIRFRSCYLESLKPRRYLWVAKFWAKVYVFLTGNDARLYSESTAKIVLAGYRNWMGENRIRG